MPEKGKTKERNCGSYFVADFSVLLCKIRLMSPRKEKENSLEVRQFDILENGGEDALAKDGRGERFRHMAQRRKKRRKEKITKFNSPNFLILALLG